MWKISRPWNPSQVSFKVIESCTIRQTGFRGNHGPISYCYRDKRRFPSKIAKFSHPLYFAPPLKGFPWNWVPALDVKKTRIIALSGGQRSLTIYSAVWIECMNVTDRQTDTGRQQRPRLRLASRGRKLYRSWSSGDVTFDTAISHVIPHNAHVISPLKCLHNTIVNYFDMRQN